MMKFMSFLEFLNPINWFSLTIPNVDGPGRFLFVFFAVLFIAGIVVRMNATKLRKIKKHFSKFLTSLATLFLTMSSLGGLLYFFSYERVRFFGARFWYPVWVIAFVIWLVLVIIYVKRKIPAFEHADKKQAEINKYLPSRKKK